MIVNIVVEGRSDEGAAEKIVQYAGHSVGRVIDKRGKTKLDPDVARYNQASRHGAWVLFRDTDGVCPVELRRHLLDGIHELSAQFRLRLAHSMTEAWLLADARSFSQYFQVPVATIARDPETLPHAKREVLRLCSNSRSREIRSAMVSSDGDVGPLYVARINEYARDHWNVDEALQSSPSLRRAVDAIRTLGPSESTS
jgi:hypothetical protein